MDRLAVIYELIVRKFEQADAIRCYAAALNASLAADWDISGVFGSDYRKARLLTTVARLTNRQFFTLS